MSETHDNADHPIDSYRTCVLTWVVLLCLTAVTIGVSRLSLGKFSTSAAVAIAAVKGSLVLLIFMGLRHDKPVFRYMFLVTILTLATFIILTYADVIFR